jgi:hypothetical protein
MVTPSNTGLPEHGPLPVSGRLTRHCTSPVARVCRAFARLPRRAYRATLPKLSQEVEGPECRKETLTRVEESGELLYLPPITRLPQAVRRPITAVCGDRVGVLWERSPAVSRGCRGAASVARDEALRLPAQQIQFQALGPVRRRAGAGVLKRPLGLRRAPQAVLRHGQEEPLVGGGFVPPVQ